MISYNEAQRIVWDAARAVELEKEAIAVAEIENRICAEDITAPVNIQPFDNAAMDGFAVQAADLRSATADTPVELRALGTAAAGAAPMEAGMPSGHCIAIMTGAVMPKGADAVVPVENVRQEGTRIFFFSEPKPHAHVRFMGEDFTKGETVVRRGERLRTAHILPLATLGIGRVSVYRKPRAVFVSTGLELVDDLSSPLRGGEIYNSNRPYAVAMLEALGVDVVAGHTVSDDAAVFAKTVQQALQSGVEMIVSSGAVSAGAFDFVKETLLQAGAEILYHRIKIKPGKPNLLARFPNGTLYFGLPGNPVATAVGVRMLVQAAVRAMTGRLPEQPERAVLADDNFSKPASLQMFLKGVITVNAAGVREVRILDGQESFKVSPFLTMNAWVSVPEGVELLQPGDTVDVYPDSV